MTFFFSKSERGKGLFVIFTGTLISRKWFLIGAEQVKCQIKCQIKYGTSDSTESIETKSKYNQPMIKSESYNYI